MRQLPGLLEPAIIAADTTGSSQGDNIQRSRTNQQERVRQAVRGAKYGSLSTFTLVETTGLAWAWKLVRDSLNKKMAVKVKITSLDSCACIMPEPEIRCPMRTKSAWAQIF